MNSFLIRAFLFSFYVLEECQGKSHPKPSCGYPPSQWCRTLEIAVECGTCRLPLQCKLLSYPSILEACNKTLGPPVGDSQVQKQCMELLATRPDPSMPPVEVTVYYESLCPGCRSFLTEQLFPTWTMLRDIMRVHLVPYGNTKELPELNSFSCQHGQPECQANIIEACILNVTNHAAFPVIHCMVSSSDVITAAPSCLQLYAPSVEWGTIESCVKGDLGHILMHENGVKTRSLSPAHTHVPWVTFNGVYTDDLEDKAMSTLFNLVCKLYEGIKPPVCTGALKKLNRSFC